MEVLPNAKHTKPRPSKLDPFEPYLKRRWDEGCKNAMQLWREVKERGYPGGYKRVHQWRQKQWLLEDIGRLKQQQLPLLYTCDRCAKVLRQDNLLGCLCTRPNDYQHKKKPCWTD